MLTTSSPPLKGSNPVAWALGNETHPNTSLRDILEASQGADEVSWQGQKLANLLDSPLNNNLSDFCN